MRLRTATLVTFALAVIAVVIAVVIGQLPGQGKSPGGGQPGGVSAPANEAAPSPSGVAGQPESTALPAPGDTSTPVPNAGQESNASGESGRAPGAVTPLISKPLPAAASRSGAIVTGFPAAVIPLAQGSTVISSSVAPGGDRVQAGLNAMSTRAPAEVLAFYDAAFTKLGLVASSVPSVDGSTAKSFVRGPSTVTVTVSPVGGGSRYTVFGVLVAGI